MEKPKTPEEILDKLEQLSNRYEVHNNIYVVRKQDLDPIIDELKECLIQFTSANEGSVVVTDEIDKLKAENATIRAESKRVLMNHSMLIQVLHIFKEISSDRELVKLAEDHIKYFTDDNMKNSEIQIKIMFDK